MHYTHLSMKEREVIYYTYTSGFNLTEIAEILERHKSTISREIRRHLQDRDTGYNAWSAHWRYESSKHWQRKRPKTGNSEIMRYVLAKLSRDWSPEEISGRLKCIDKSGDPSSWISHETIYRLVQADKQKGGELYKHLRQGLRKRRKRYGSPSNRGQIRDRVSIEQRPEIVEKRERIGDWESDTVVGKNHKSFLATSVDRRSRYLIARKMKDKSASSLNQALMVGFKNIPREKIKTITVDNGKEFAKFKELEKSLNTNFYFAHPYSSWERGSNENTNGLLRQFIPKKTNINDVSKKQLAKYVRSLNNRPRKILNYRTPCEVFLNKTMLHL